MQRPDWVRDKTIVLLLQLAMQKHIDLGDIPLILDLAKSDEERQALSLIFAPESMGRPFFAPPGVASKRAALLRAAFAKLVNDPGFKAAAKKAKLDVSFMDGGGLEKIVKQISTASPSSIELAKRMTQRQNTEVETRPK